MSFSLPILKRIRRHQELTNQRLYSGATIRMLRLVPTSHSNTRCKSTFGSFMIKRIGTNDARPVYSVFLARLSPGISARCPKIKHHRSKSEARRHNNEGGIFVPRKTAILDLKNNSLHKRLWLNDKRNDNLGHRACVGELARMLIPAKEPR